MGTRRDGEQGPSEVLIRIQSVLMCEYNIQDSTMALLSAHSGMCLSKNCRRRKMLDNSAAIKDRSNPR